MQPKWLIFLGWLFIIGVIAAGVAEYVYFGKDESTIVTGLMTEYQIINFSNPITGIATIARAAWSYFLLFLRMLMWDYACFTGVLVIFRLFGMLISASLILSMILAIRGTSSA